MTPRSPPDSPAPSFRVYYVGVLALLTRLLYLTEHARSALFSFPVLDARYYDTAARLLAAGDADGLAILNPGFRPLLYPWLLSLFHRVAPEAAPALAIAGQHLLGVASTLLVARVAWAVSRSNRIAATAGVLFALAGPPLYFEGELLITALSTFLNLCLVAVLVALCAGDDTPAGRRSWIPWALAGALLGVCAQARPNVLLFALALPLFALTVGRAGGKRSRQAPQPGRSPRSARWRPAVFGLAGLLASLAVFGGLQRGVFGDFQMVSGSGGVNFYLGNKRTADGMIPRQDREVTYAEEYRDSVEVFARSEYGRLTGADPGRASPGEISRFWLGQGLREISADPLRWAGLMLRKGWFIVFNREIPNNRDYDFVRAEESRLLRRLPVGWWLLVGLAPIGLLRLRREANPRQLYWLVAFPAFWIAGMWLFFVNSRYRAPLWPFFCVFAAAGAVHLFGLARERDWRRLGTAAASVILLAGLSLVNWLGVNVDQSHRDFFYRSLANQEAGRPDEAEADARRAVAAEPKDAAYHFQLGAVLLDRDRNEEAVAALRRAGELKPVEPRIWNGLGVALERLGRQAEGYANYRKAIEQVPGFGPALTNAALLELRAGRVSEAAEHLAGAETVGERSLPFLCARAFLARAEGRASEAARFLEEARAIDGDTTARLDAESRIPAALF